MPGWFSKLFGVAAEGTGEVIASGELARAPLEVTAFSEGYDQDEVHATLDRCVATIDAYERGAAADTGVLITAGEVVTVRFRQTKFRAGYDQEAVDDLLDRVVVTLRSFEEAVAADEG